MYNIKCTYKFRLNITFEYKISNNYIALRSLLFYILQRYLQAMYKSTYKFLFYFSLQKMLVFIVFEGNFLFMFPRFVYMQPNLSDIVTLYMTQKTTRRDVTCMYVCKIDLNLLVFTEPSITSFKIRQWINLKRRLDGWYYKNVVQDRCYFYSICAFVYYLYNLRFSKECI